MIDNLIWDELSLEVLSAAHSGMTVKDFEVQCRLAPLANGKTFFDRIRVAEALISDKLITIEDGFLKLTHDVIPESLVENLKRGSPVAWKILDCISPSDKLLHKLDLDLLNRIGLEGELSVISELKKSLLAPHLDRIKHISLVDDSAGFDIQSPSTKSPEDTLLLEVKTSVRPGDNFTFYISKNEARVAKQNDNWFLIGVDSNSDGYRVLGSLRFNSFSDFLPINMSTNGQWESAKITISKSMFIGGLP